jgi:hypothetical protein
MIGCLSLGTLCHRKNQREQFQDDPVGRPRDVSIGANLRATHRVAPTIQDENSVKYGMNAFSKQVVNFHRRTHAYN